MTKEIKDVILTEREQDVIKWLARGVYENIRGDFDEDGKQSFLEPYMTVVMMLDQHDSMNAMYFICMLLEQGYNGGLAELMTKVSKPGDGSVELFLKEFRENFICDSNLQRSTILPSEKAFSYKMRLEAMNRQGKRTDLTFSPTDKKLRSGENFASEVGESQA